MKRLKYFIVFTILNLVMVMNASHARSLEDIQNSGTLNVVTSAANPPGGFVDPKTNSLQGVMVDVANAVAKHMDVKADMTNVPFSGLIASLRSGRADIISAPLFITEERSQAVDFTEPLYGWGEGVIVEDSFDGQYTSLEDLEGKTVATLVDSVQYRMINDLPGVTIKTYPDYTTLLADVKAKRVDLGVVDPPSIIHQMQSKSIAGAKLDDSYEAKQVWWVGVATQKDNSELLDQLNSIIADMKSSGELKEILEKWGVEDYIAD